MRISQIVDSTFYVLGKYGRYYRNPHHLIIKNKTYKSDLKKVEFESLVYYDKEKQTGDDHQRSEKESNGLTAHVIRP